jgi:hypothetical protein
MKGPPVSVLLSPPTSLALYEFSRRALGVLGAVLAATLAAAQTPLINEVQSSNERTCFDEEGDSPDWIELWNPGTVAFDLSGCGLSDKAKKPFKWVFAPGTVIGAGEYMVAFASGKDRQPAPIPALAPENLAGLEVWLRADAVDVRSAGDAACVRRWRDLSGHGNDASAPSDAQQPKWVAAGPRGPAAVRFDGAHSLLRLPRPPATNDFCIFAVYRTARSHEVQPENRAGTDGTRGQKWLFGATKRSDQDAGAGISVGTNGVSVYEHGSGYLPPLLSYRRPIGSGFQVIAVNYLARRPSLDVQGLTVRTGMASSRREVCAPVEIGSGEYGAFAGDLIEVLMFNRALSIDQRRGVARHLAERYAIPLPLPKHANFQLSANGDMVVLTGRDGTTLDRVSFGAIPRGSSYGRLPSGSTNWRFFATPTPGGPNVTPGSAEWLLPPVFSHAGGFCSNEFELTLTNPNGGGEIRFTLDGADPGTNSTLYVELIRISSRVGTPNDLSAIPTAPGSQPPVGEVFKGWTVRARVFRTNALPSLVSTRTFWVDPAGPRRYTLPVLGITTDRRNFFDPKIGIYVAGRAAGGNYSQRGAGWERPVHVELYEADGTAVLDQDGGAKIHGHTSQTFPIKGLDLHGRFGAGRRPFRCRLFPDRERKSFDHFLVRPSGHDYGGALMRDEVMQALEHAIGEETQAARPCVVFLNGEYWGLHYLKEKEDTEFVSFYGNVSEEDLDYLEGFATAKAGDTAHYDAMAQFIATNNLTLLANYSRLQSWMEVPSFIDVKVCEIFNYRWDLDNHRLWRPRTPEGRWRWVQFDYDVGWGGYRSEPPAWEYDLLAAELSTDGRLYGHNNEAATFLLRHLVGNREFQRDFINRFADLLNTVFQPSNTVGVVNAFAALLAPEMDEHCRRWHAPASPADWQRAVDSLREFARRRPDFCRQHLVRQFKLPGAARLSLSVQPLNRGAIQVNTINVSSVAGAAWVGIYFQGNPIRLTARPQPGWRFARWAGLRQEQTNTVDLVLHGDQALTAHFEPELSRPVSVSPY